jgi:hypothetical protein
MTKLSDENFEPRGCPTPGACSAAHLLAALADEINALKAQLAHEKSVVDGYKYAREYEVKRGQGYADQLSAIKGRLTEDQLLALLNDTIPREPTGSDINVLAKAIISRVLGEQHD